MQMICQVESLSQFHRPTTDRRHLLRISLNSRFTYETTQHRNFRCTKDTLLEVRIQLVALHDLEHLFQVPKMNLNIAEVTLSATVDKDVINVTGRKVPKWSQHLRYHAIVSAGAFFNPYGITSHSHSIPLEVLTAASGVSLGCINI